MLQNNFSFGMERDDKLLELNDLDQTKWSNPLESRCVTCSYQHLLEQMKRTMIDFPMLLPSRYTASTDTERRPRDHTGLFSKVLSFSRLCLL